MVDIFKRHIHKDDLILEIGAGDWGNVRSLTEAGYGKVIGIDKNDGSSIEDFPLVEFDTIFTMSCLFLIPKENEWIFEKIAKMTKKWLITIEGETSKGEVTGRDYGKIFTKLGFDEVEHNRYAFNIYGHIRIFKKNGTT